MNSCPSVCIFSSGVNPAVSPKSYAYTPRVNEGQADGSTARNVGLARPASFSRRNGRKSPAKLDPPPVHPTMRSGMSSPAAANCLIASWPITVWCISTWLSTLPSAYRVSALPPAASTASLIAMPRLPGESGSSARIFAPADVARDGLACTVAPQVSIIVRRYGFWS
jgi:hypothetical protein